MTVKVERARFIGGAGFELAGMLHVPQTRVLGNILLAHCFTCSKNIRVVAYLARALAEVGYSVLRFDFTGIGESEGDFTDTTLSSDLADMIAAADFMTDIGFPPEVLMGHSLGAVTALLSAEHIQSVRAVITLGSPASAEHIKTVFSHSLLDQVHQTGMAKIFINNKEYSITRAFIDDLGSFDLLSKINSLKKPLMIVHGTSDELVDISEAEKIFSAANQPKFFIPVINGNHLFTGENDFPFVLKSAQNFLEQTLPLSR